MTPVSTPSKSKKSTQSKRLSAAEKLANLRKRITELEAAVSIDMLHFLLKSDCNKQENNSKSVLIKLRKQKAKISMKPKFTFPVDDEELDYIHSNDSTIALPLELPPTFVSLDCPSVATQDVLFIWDFLFTFR